MEMDDQVVPLYRLEKGQGGYSDLSEGGIRFMKINEFVLVPLALNLVSASIAFASSYGSHDPMYAGMIGAVKFLGIAAIFFVLWIAYKLLALIFKKAGEGLNKLGAGPAIAHRDQENNEDR